MPTMYHWTHEWAAEQIIADGFSFEYTGRIGGAEFGPAIYLAPTPEERDRWEVDMRFFIGAGLVCLEVEVGDVRLFDCADEAAKEPILLPYLERQRYYDPAIDALTECGREAFLALDSGYGALGIMLARALKELGYDGLMARQSDGKNQVVIWNIEKVQVR